MALARCWKSLSSFDSMPGILCIACLRKLVATPRTGNKHGNKVERVVILPLHCTGINKTPTGKQDPWSFLLGKATDDYSSYDQAMISYLNFTNVSTSPDQVTTRTLSLLVLLSKTQLHASLFQPAILL